MWIDKKTYWAWNKPRLDKDGKIIPVPPTPTKKRLDYVSVNISPNGTQRLCIGVWDDDKYTPVNRDELEWHAKQRTFNVELAKTGNYFLVNRPGQLNIKDDPELALYFKHENKS